MTRSSPDSIQYNIEHLHRAIELALEAERIGNLPIGAVITLEDKVIAEAGSAILVPDYNPGQHAEMEAFRRVPASLWHRSAEMTCYTTLEPCYMCTGAILLHRIGRVVFGARDVLGGGSLLLKHLPEYYSGGFGIPVWTGPVLAEVCDQLYE